jgi:hypothetical protein
MQTENYPPSEDEILDRLEAFGVAVQKMIDEAISARDASGIESRWIEDLRQYYGSEISQHSYRSMTQMAQEGVTDAVVSGDRQTRSRISVNITRPKTNAAISRISEMMLPTDDKNFAIRPTPNPDLSSDLTRGHGTVLTVGGQPIMKPDGTELTAADAAKQAIEEAAERAKRMEREIEDQLVECNYNAEFRKGIWDFCVLGTMILRGPFVKRYVGKKWTKLPDGWMLQIEEKYAPAVVRVSPWNFYPDPAAGGDIEKARYVVEVEEFNAKTLRELRGQQGYITSQINECLNEGPKASKAGRGRRAGIDRIVPGEYVTPDDAVFDVYIVHGEFTRGDLEAAGVEGCECESDEERQDAVSGCVFICNGRPIKAYLNPLDSGELPYSVAQYERIEGQMFGVGIPYILRNPSKVVTAGWRMMMDNAALSAGGQIVINRKLIEPADKSWALTGSKIWFSKDGVVDVGHAFKTYQFDTRQAEIQAIIERALRFAEDESSIPSLLEGNQGQAPDQVGSMTLLYNNANTVLRRVVKTIDDCITDTMISRFYDWNMQYNEDDSIKGDFQVDARGSSALIQRDMQKQMLLQIATYVLHPVLAKFHKNAGYDWLKSVYEMNQIDAKSILVGEDEATRIIQQMQQQPPPQDPKVAVAQIKAQLDSAKLQASMQDAERERQADIQKMNLQYQLEVIKYANENKMKLEDVKARMTELLLQHRHEERMQQRELDIKARMGSGI